MRFKLTKGKQKELILLAKRDLSWDQFSKKLGISSGYLRNELRKEERLLCEKIYRKLLTLSGKNYDKFILEKLDNNWERSKGGTLSPGNTKQIKKSPYSKKLAEIIGVILGDGSICAYKSYKVGTYQIRIAGHSELDKDYLLYYIKPLFEKLFGVKVGVSYSKKSQCMWLIITGKNLVRLFESYGLANGNKIENNQGIPNWVQSNNEYLKECIRGLVDTDGSIYKMSNKDPKLLRINFTNHCNKLLCNFFDSLWQLGYNPHKSSRQVFLSRKKEIKNFVDIIKFHNKKHINSLGQIAL